jgi:hypothetical protein
MGNYSRAKGRKNSGSFLLLPHSIINHENFARLSPRAVKMLINIAGQFNGKNNGDPVAKFSHMKIRNWNSNDQITRAKNELLKIPALYGVTWQ